MARLRRSLPTRDTLRRIDGRRTVYGYAAPLSDEHPAGMALLLVGFALPAAWAGWRGLAPSLTVGAALAMGPTLLAFGTAPRGDNDGLWVLMLFLLPMLGVGAAIVAELAHRIATNRRRSRSEGGATNTSPASPSERLAALIIDVIIIGGLLVMPLTNLSHAKREVLALLIGVVGGVTYLAVPLAWKGATLGQSLVGLVTLGPQGRRLSVPRAFLRSLIVVVELVGVPTFLLALPAIAELLAVSNSGRSLTDRLLGTSVVSSRQRTVGG